MINFGFGKRDREGAVPGRLPTATRRLTPTQALFLDRLTRLVRKVDLHGRYLVATDRRMLLLNRAVLSTFCDCRELGVEDEARAILAGLRRGLELPIPTPEAPR